MNVLFGIIRKLGHKRSLSDSELSRISNGLSYLTQAGFKVEWLWSKLEMADLGRKKRDACQARILELKQEVKKLERAMSGLKADLKNEKVKLNHSSFRNFLGVASA
ncbi:unnamed protein product [Eruca vesicaria subsp. sativa]|uniref:Uncharacterized protein n=1 Tax=Eruca vesicaria subsp. sativa TaxID=29727 RepID=A0ABC8LPG5_ERUVS|nr:unnamed protein product [Eruca vesicaria subsp. sativa]